MPRSAANCLLLQQGRPEISSRRVLATATSPGTPVATSTATTAPSSASAAHTERNRGGRWGNNLGPSGQCRGLALGRIRGLNGSRGFFSRTGCFGGHSLRSTPGPCHLATLVGRHFAGNGPGWLGGIVPLHGPHPQMGCRGKKHDSVGVVATPNSQRLARERGHSPQHHSSETGPPGRSPAGRHARTREMTSKKTL